MRKYDKNTKEKKVPVALIITIAIVLILTIICIPIIRKNANKKLVQNNKQNEKKQKEEKEKIEENNNEPEMYLESRKVEEKFENKENMIKEESLKKYGYKNENTILRVLSNENGIEELIFKLKNVDKIMIVEQEVNKKGDLVDGKTKETIDAKGKDHLILYALLPENAPNTKIVAVGKNDKKLEIPLKINSQKEE